jgi:hypothetical protein
MNARLERKLRSLAAVIVAGVIAGVSPDTPSKTFWSSFIYSAVLSVVMNLASRGHQHHRTTRIPEFLHWAVPYAGGGEALRD